VCNAANGPLCFLYEKAPHGFRGTPFLTIHGF